MSDDKNITKGKPSTAAERALAEAAERRAAQEAREAELAEARKREKGGPKKAEPTRFGDWERDGRAYDF
ncbi:MAG: DUF1674 domain-containing protein [Henriciella sp.]|nr:DUF1674 domain-containing protein [Henriciella sp.]